MQGPSSDPAQAVPSAMPSIPIRPLEPLIAEYCAIYGPSWKPATARKHRDDFARLLRWLADTGRPATVASLDFLTLAAYVTDLRARPRIHGVWRGSPDAAWRSQAAGPPEIPHLTSQSGFGDEAKTASATQRMRGLLKSMPPTRVL
jgi:hypothetical protein